MPYVPVNLLLDRDVMRGDTLNLPYPRGKNEGSFFSAINHNMGIDGQFYLCPKDFVVTMRSDHIALHWHGPRDLKRGTLLNLQLEEPGGDFYFDQKRGTTILNMVQSSLYLVNLGGPKVENANLYVRSQPIPVPGNIVISGEQPYTSRNVVVHSTQDNSHCVFRLEGVDLYGRPMVEDLKGPTAESGRTDGNKAFTKLTKITVQGDVRGEISVGSGSKLGLPVFLPASGFVIREMMNGVAVAGGVVTPGETRFPTATTSDTRGTYSPPRPQELDGRTAIHLLVSLPSPGNIGLPDFTG